MDKEKIYILTLPSGNRILARKVDSIAVMLSKEVVFFPIYLSVLNEDEFIDGDAESEHKSFLEFVDRVCGAAIVDPNVDVGFLPFNDRVHLYNWCKTPELSAPVHEERDLPLDILQGIARNGMSLVLDAICKRYGKTPSQLLGIADSAIAFDFDFAIAVRAIRREAAAASGEVVVEDGFGRKHRLPREVLPTGQIPQGSQIQHADDIAKKYGSVVIKG